MANASGVSVNNAPSGHIEEEEKAPADALVGWDDNVFEGFCEYTVDQVFT